MKLYLIRHGIAVERGIYANDADRPLTDKGRQKTQKVAQRLYDIGLRWDLVLTSPLVRAYQTADILQDRGLTQQVEKSSHLSPGGDFQDWLSWLSGWRDRYSDKNLALVGHQPNLGNWTELLVWGEVTGNIIVKKAGIIGIKLPISGTPMGNSELFLLTPPKYFGNL
ncbi:phosphohistidine phosphatase, SixA [Xenococcus sp. PCC 7305]|uniref:phosphohistidine phosphatase SixA n=1 Tax=Xenococcus sp. PCC 7305 TaxID=102125 RepID=UPI0002ACE45B|nr:phosphohistidine phosphatase SixA [Xenococcus sp. PCC 7305]ELS03543.1 phosphohistidine phosphatase, SixA [Xenococcus sp. PCC 7305]